MSERRASLVDQRQFDAQGRARARWARQTNRPSDRLDAVSQAEQSRALGRVRATAPVVANLYTKGTSIGGHRDVDDRGISVLGCVRQRLRDDVVGRHFHRFWKALIRAEIEVDAERRAGNEPLERRRQAVLREPGRMDPEGDLAEVIERRREAVYDAAQLASVLLELLGNRRLRRAQREREPNQLLLRAVVEVAFDPAPGRVGRGDDSCA